MKKTRESGRARYEDTVHKKGIRMRITLTPTKKRRQILALRANNNKKNIIIRCGKKHHQHALKEIVLVLLRAVYLFPAFWCASIFFVFSFKQVQTHRGL